MIETVFSERITLMGKNAVPLDLSAQSWPELAARVHYRAAVLAEHWKVHPRRLQREFRRQLKTTPQKYLDLIRVSKIKELARQRMRTKEICVRLEYKHESQVCRQFHAIAGMGLKTFRRAMA